MVSDMKTFTKKWCKIAAQKIVLGEFCLTEQDFFGIGATIHIAPHPHLRPPKQKGGRGGGGGGMQVSFFVAESPLSGEKKRFCATIRIGREIL